MEKAVLNNLKPGLRQVLRSAVPLAFVAGVMLSCQAPTQRQTRFAMSTTLTILLSRTPDWQELFDFADRAARQFDHRLEDSPIARLNRDGEAHPPPEVLEVLKAARAVAEASEGAFDPTILPLTELWSFDSGGRLPEAGRIEEARRRVDYRRLVIKADGRVSLPEGFGLDLGGIAKGAVIDLLADHLSSLGYEDFLIDAGGDILVSGLKQGRTPWRIAIRHPRDSQAMLGVLELGQKGGRVAVVTSGDYERFFEKDGVRYHHILDPRTGYPARKLASVTVMAPACGLADALATAAFVLGPEKGLKLLEEFPGVEGLLVAEREGRLAAWKTGGFPGELTGLELEQ
jgi:thiamine biosynthesis lipoprotein